MGLAGLSKSQIAVLRHLRAAWPTRGAKYSDLPRHSSAARSDLFDRGLVEQRGRGRNVRVWITGDGIVALIGGPVCAPSAAIAEARRQVSYRTQRVAMAQNKWDNVHIALDELRVALEDCAGRDLQGEFDVAGRAVDAFLASAGVKER